MSENIKKIRFGIVGTGTIAHRFANAIKNVENAELVAVASRTKENAQKFGDEFNIKNRFYSYKDMAESDTIDAAYIAVPHSEHIHASLLMMNNKKHVLCEKPMCINTKEAVEMFNCSKENDVLLMEAMWARLVPGTLKMLEIVESGKLGDILGVEGKFCYAFDEDELDHHALKNANGGGSLLDVGVYGLNFASWYLGKEVLGINAQANIFNDVDAHTCVLLKYKSGAIADVSSAVLLRKPNEGYIYGTKGYAYLPRFYAPQEIKLQLNNGESEIISTPYKGNGFEEQITHFSDCVLKGLKESPIVTHEQTFYITKQMDEIRKIINLEYPQDN